MSKRYCIFLSALFCAFLAVFLVAGAVSPRTSPSPSWRTATSSSFPARGGDRAQRQVHGRL